MIDELLDKHGIVMDEHPLQLVVVGEAYYQRIVE